MAVNRINEFLEAVKICRSENEFKTLAYTELEYLDNHLVLSSKKRALTDYRNVLKLVYPIDHCIFKFLNLTREEKLIFTIDGKKQVKEDHTHLRSIDPIGFVEMGSELILNRKSYSKVAIGLCLLTGRRDVEILKTANFDYISDNEVLFTGQVKRKNCENNPYPIPVLGNASQIIEALGFIRSKLDVTDVEIKTVHSKCNKTTNEAVKTTFCKLTPNISVKSLRAIYAEICVYWLCEKSMSKANFMAKILGHSELDLSTAQTYEDFYIED